MSVFVTNENKDYTCIAKLKEGHHTDIDSFKILDSVSNKVL